MRTREFERIHARWVQAAILGLVLALGGAAISCKTKASAETEAEASESDEESSASEKKAGPKDEQPESHAAEVKPPSDDQTKPAQGKESKAGADKKASHETPEPPMSAEQALARLKAGNQAFLKGSINISHLIEERRVSLAKGQHPFAIILSCSDSRVPPEEIFAQGLGDLFTVRVAGNIADPATIASIEYAAEHLGVPLLLVMGHTECGAVKAAIAGAHDTPSLTELVKAIQPAIAKLPKEKLAADTEPAVRANISHARAEVIKQSPLLSELSRAKKLKVAEAIYDLKTGQVKFLK